MYDDLEADDGVFGTQIIGGNTGLAYYIYAHNDKAGVFSPNRAAYKYHAISVNKEEELVINEVLASNKNGKKDETGEHEDWIELYNNSGKVINIEGWFCLMTQRIWGNGCFPKESKLIRINT